MKIQVDQEIHLSPFHAGDKAALVEHLQERAISERTLRIPYPYTSESADTWLALADRIDSARGQTLNFAIRDVHEFLIGGCGFELSDPASQHAELGYWLAKSYWGKGIMTRVVAKLIDYAWRDLGLTKLTAQVYIDNPASGRVLEKCGFAREGDVAGEDTGSPRRPAFVYSLNS